MGKGKGKKLSFDRVAELYRVYCELIKGFEADGEHEQLLLAHCVDMHHKLKLMVAKNQERYTFMFSPTEAMAFTQFWERVSYPMELYVADIVRKLVEIARQFSNGSIS